MSKRTSFDVLIIGAGQAGIPLAHALAKADKWVGLAEREHLGGSCALTTVCTPTKAVISSARMVHQARRAAEFGLRIPIVEVDFQAVLERAKHILMESRNGLSKGLEDSDNPKLLCGHKKIQGQDAKGFRIRINDEVVTAEQVVLDTGTRSLIPPIDGLADLDFIHSENWLARSDLPKHLGIIGGGYIGLEMVQLYRRMGSRVTVIEESGQIASREDEDVALALYEVPMLRSLLFFVAFVDFREVRTAITSN